MNQSRTPVPGGHLIRAVMCVGALAVVSAAQRGAPAAGDPAPQGRGRGAAAPLPPPVVPKPLVKSSEPARTCDSLRSLTLPNTSIESAVVDPGTAGVPA